MSTVERDADHGHLFVVRDVGRIVATVTAHETDPTVWGTDTTTPSLYLHRLVVAHSHRGQQLGVRLLDWAVSNAAQKVIPFVRLNCATHNEPLRKFYEKQGFQFRRDVEVESMDGTRKVLSSLYERATTGARSPHCS